MLRNLIENWGVVVLLKFCLGDVLDVEVSWESYLYVFIYKFLFYYYCNSYY